MTLPFRPASFQSDGERKIIVHFYALISEDFNVDPSRDKILIRGYLERELGWKNMEHVMKYTG